MNAENIEVKYVSCFGWRCKNKNEGWWYIANTLANKSWNDINRVKLEMSLADDVKQCQDHLMSATFKDVESDTDYVVTFENDRKLWNLSIKDSPEAPITKEDKKTFFTSECWKMTCRRALQIFERTVKTMDQFVTPKLESGDLLKVDELAYSKISKLLHDPNALKAIKLYKYIH